MRTTTAAAANDGGKEDAAAASPLPLPPLLPPIPTPTTATNISSGGGGAMGPPAAINDMDDDTSVEDDDMLLVSEFPPPPYYYSLASRSSSSGEILLTPPEIPYRAFRVAAKKAKMEHQKRKLIEEEERRRALQLSPLDTMEGTIKGDGSEVAVVTTDKKHSKNNAELGDDDSFSSIDVENPNEPLVAVFGEIVEDPTLFQASAGYDIDEEKNGLEGECHDPAIVRENVKRLNRDVLHGFLLLVRKLAEDPSDHRKLRDELSHNLFLMLQECNKFREHQARELLIDTLELQLQRRALGLELLKEKIGSADDALIRLQKFREEEEMETGGGRG